MPPNNPFLPDAIEKFLNFINGKRRSKEEKALDEATANLPGTLETYGAKNPIVENQPVKVMETPAQLANFLTLQANLLAGQPESQKKILDVGTFTGSSALAMAKGLPEGGKVISCDTRTYLNDEQEDIAKKYWREAGVADRIDHRVGNAVETLDGLLKNGEAGSFDMVFIDADKANYGVYYDKALQLLRPGGLVILDNMLWSGYVADPSRHDPDTEALRKLDIRIAEDQKNLDIAALLGFEDGVMIAQKHNPNSFVARHAKSDSQKELAP